MAKRTVEQAAHLRTLVEKRERILAEFFSADRTLRNAQWKIRDRIKADHDAKVKAAMSEFLAEQIEVDHLYALDEELTGEISMLTGLPRGLMPIL